MKQLNIMIQKTSIEEKSCNSDCECTIQDTCNALNNLKIKGKNIFYYAL